MEPLRFFFRRPGPASHRRTLCHIRAALRWKIPLLSARSVCRGSAGGLQPALRTLQDQGLAAKYRLSRPTVNTRGGAAIAYLCFAGVLNLGLRPRPPSIPSSAAVQRATTDQHIHQVPSHPGRGFPFRYGATSSFYARSWCLCHRAARRTSKVTLTSHWARGPFTDRSAPAN